MQIKIQLLHPEARIPCYKSENAAGFDFYAIEDISIPAGKSILARTGLALELPEGYELQIRPRSGLALNHQITILNSPGTIDSDYRGEIGIILINHSCEIFKAKKHDRIAQGVLNKIQKASFKLEKSLTPTSRGEKGYGSTGLKDVDI